MKPILLGPKEQLAAEQFRAFYARLIDLRDAILGVTVAPEGAPADPAGPTAPIVPANPAAPEPAPAAPPRRVPGVAEARATLRQLILDLGYHPDPRADAALDAGYVMAAVADEVLLLQCAGWAGYGEWIDRPLETILYGTSLAGDRVFETARVLVAQERDDPRTATTILLALLIGFRGRYHDPRHRSVIDALQRDLYRLVCHRDYLVDDPAPYAAPNLSATTLTGESMRPLPVLWPWIVGIALVLLAYLPLSHLVWWSDAARIDAAAGRIIAKHEAREDGRTTEMRP